MSTRLNFDVAKVDTTDTYTPIPAGDYLVAVKKVEMKPTKSGTGTMLQMTLAVIEGEHKNRVVFERLNVVNENVTAQEIAQRRVAQYSLFSGKHPISDAADLVNCVFAVTVGVRTDPTGQYAPSNEVRSVKQAPGVAAAPRPAANPPVAAVPAAAPNSTPPWAT
jgi:hypothetical protein